MTLVVVKKSGSKVFIFADTRLSEHGKALPPDQGIIKTAFIAPHIAVAYSNSPDLAARDINEFSSNGINPNYLNVTQYFKESSLKTNNEYLIAFADTARVVKISIGIIERSVSQTHWIGDEGAFERFNSFERGKTKFDLGAPWSMNTWPLDWVQLTHAQAVGNWLDISSAVLMAPDIGSTGDFLTVATNVGATFRFLPHSKLFYDNARLQSSLFKEAELVARGENRAYQYSAIVPLEPAVNGAGFYFPQAQIAYIFYAPKNEVVASKCRLIKASTTDELVQHCKDECGIEFVVIETAHLARAI